MDDLDDDRFAPLTGSELRAGSVPGAAKEASLDCILPVPANAPPMPAAIAKLGRPSRRWSYRDTAGALLFEVWRFDPRHERKQFLPLSLWREPSGALRWCWKAVPSPRPLYGLDRLAARPDASVALCEGEKAAEAAMKVFPESVCITSPGGCKAAAKADWKPLTGRRVLIWPDCDEPGTKYANDVAHILHGQGCGVSIVDAAALAGLAPGGSSRDSAKGWDAADAMAEWRDLGALRKAAHELAKPFQETLRKGNGFDAQLAGDGERCGNQASLGSPACQIRARAQGCRGQVRAPGIYP